MTEMNEFPPWPSTSRTPSPPCRRPPPYRRRLRNSEGNYTAAAAATAAAAPAFTSTLELKSTFEKYSFGVFAAGASYLAH